MADQRFAVGFGVDLGNAIVWFPDREPNLEVPVVPGNPGGAGSDPTAIAARYQAKGNIFIGNDQNIWIYS